jgi:hypothetical protein
VFDSRGSIPCRDVSAYQHVQLYTEVPILCISVYLGGGKGHPITGHQWPRGGVEV